MLIFLNSNIVRFFSGNIQYTAADIDTKSQCRRLQLVFHPDRHGMRPAAQIQTVTRISGCITDYVNRMWPQGGGTRRKRIIHRKKRTHRKKRSTRRR
jgi:hypothetical protein